MEDPALATQMDTTSMIDQSGKIKELYKSEERMSRATLLPPMHNSPKGNINFQVGSQSATKHIHVPLGLPLNQLGSSKRMGGRGNKNLNLSMSTIYQAQVSQHTSSSLQNSMLANQTYQTNRKRAVAIEAEVQRINKLMNVDMGTFHSNVSRLRVQRSLNREQVAALKVIEE